MVQHGATLVGPERPGQAGGQPPSGAAPGAAPGPTLGLAPPGPDARPERGRLDRGTALRIGVGAPAMAVVNILVEPLPADPQAPVPVLATALFLVFITAVVATATTAARRLPRALGWAMLAGAMAVVLAVACPLSGHHAGVGWWWYTQMALSTGFLAVAARGLRQHRSAPS